MAAINSTLHQLADVEHAKERVLFTGVNAVGSAADEVDKVKAAAVAAAKTALANSGNKTDLLTAVNTTLAFKAGAEGSGLTMVALPTSFQAATAAAAGGSGDITCYEDEATGVVAGWSQGGTVTCRYTTKTTVIPLTGAYVNGIKVSMDKRTGAIGRMVFEVIPNAFADHQYVKPKLYYCGSAGGLYAKEVLPANSALAGLAGTCAATSGGRRLTAAPGSVDPGTTLVVAAPLVPGAGPLPSGGVRMVRTLAETAAFVIKNGGTVP